jgi:ribosome-associated translation inhibitor RaiA
MSSADQLSSQSKMSEQFTAGYYNVEPIFFEVLDGTIRLGAKSDRADIWAVWDNFELTYYGPDANINTLKFGDKLDQLADLREQAEALKSEVEVAAVTKVLDDALAATANVERTTAAIDAALNTLTNAVDKGQASVKAKNVLPQMKELTESTNFYTQEAYDTYYGNWEAKYEAGTLTKSEADALQDPFLVTGWHAAITVDNLLLSVWDTNPDFVDAPYYINTWSTEGIEGSGNYAGAEFGVPFFEYWTGDDSSLGEKTLTATLTGLQPGVYNVGAQVRVRGKNSYEAPAYGITMQVCDGQAVDVTAGQQVGTSQFYLDNFTAKGTVAADGVLTLKFQVAADNNISWLSFKNVKYAYDDVATGILTVGSRQNAEGVYSISGQKVEKTRKGLYIQNGKKVVIK